MEYGEEPDFGGPPDGYTADEDVLSSALENHWDEIKEAVEDARGSDWLKDSATCLELLSTVSQRDFTRLRGGLKKYLRRGKNDGDLLTDEHVFAIAADIASFIEKLPLLPPKNGFLNYLGGGKFQARLELTPSRCVAIAASKCNLGEDLAWAKDLLTVTNAFRDILSALSDPDLQEPFLRIHIRESFETLNHFLGRTPALLLVHWPMDGKKLSFGRCPDPEVSDLAAYIAGWISDYLTNYYPRVGIGVCAECG